MSRRQGSESGCMLCVRSLCSQASGRMVLSYPHGVGVLCRSSCLRSSSTFCSRVLTITACCPVHAGGLTGAILRGCTVCGPPRVTPTPAAAGPGPALLSRREYVFLWPVDGATAHDADVVHVEGSRLSLSLLWSLSPKDTPMRARLRRDPSGAVSRIGRCPLMRMRR